MEQFSLEEYLAHPERKIVTRDGRNVRILCTDRETDGIDCIVALVKDEENYESVVTYRIDGNNFGGEKTGLDLFFAPIKHEGWVNLFHSQGELSIIKIYSTKQDALDARLDDVTYLTAKIEWED